MNERKELKEFALTENAIKSSSFAERTVVDRARLMDVKKCEKTTIVAIVIVNAIKKQSNQTRHAKSA
jgi:hypothetical protein